MVIFNNHNLPQSGRLLYCVLWPDSVKQLLNFLCLCKTLYLPMDDILTHERKRKWFVWGTVVTCTLSIPLIIGMSNAFRGISTEKATGLAAVAGGLAEGLCDLWGGSCVRAAHNSDIPVI